MAAGDPDTNMDKRTKRLLLKTLLTRPDFLLSVLVGMLALVTVYYWLLLQVSTLERVFDNISREPVYLAAVSALIPLALALFGLNFGVAIILFRAGGGLKWQGGALLGALVGGFGASCPVCGAFLLSLIGISAGLGALPFAGLELWSASAGLMALALVGSLRTLDRSACDLTVQIPSCWRLPEVSRNVVVILLLFGLGLVVSLYLLLANHEPFLLRL